MTTVYGSGFQSGENVTLTVGGMVLGSAAANDTGAFMMDVQIDLALGVHSLVATGDAGSTMTSAPLVVIEEK